MTREYCLQKASNYARSDALSNREFPLRLTENEVGLVREALGNLVGQPLTHMVRAIGFQYFSFGEQKPVKNFRAEDSTDADWGLAVGGDCTWQFRGPNGFSLGTCDFAHERKDDHAEPFYELMDLSPFVVESVTVSEDGAQMLQFSACYTLEVTLPTHMGYTSNSWRFMPPESDFRGHLVLQGLRVLWGYRLNRGYPRRRPNNTPARRRYRKSRQFRPIRRVVKKCA